MKLFAKAALGALALASAAVAMVNPADAARIVVTTSRPVVVERNVCLRAPEFRPAFCFRHRDARSMYWRHMARIDRERAREARQAFLERRWEMNH